ncbi:unnamed protein product [Mytilus edulis]|uniref:Uncharacterized protein n=1 Tax=Mytilus edulis TaxID=6550 RepID=A0A8S3RUY7_MYTED|nr:unnamed protein product [Mytilus edulis]
MWLNKIKDIWNNLAHVTSIKEFDDGRLQKWCDQLEGSILCLASKMPFTTYAVMVEDQTRQKLIQTQLEQDKTEILSKTENLLQKFSTEQRGELQRFYDMILQCSIKPIHETIDHGIEKIMIEIDNLVLLISCSTAVETTESVVDAENADLEQSAANTSPHFRTGHESERQVHKGNTT